MMPLVEMAQQRSKRPRVDSPRCRASSSPASSTAVRQVSSHRYGTRSATKSAARITTAYQLGLTQQCSPAANYSSIECSDTMKRPDVPQHAAPSYIDPGAGAGAGAAGAGAVVLASLISTTSPGLNQRSSMRVEPTHAGCISADDMMKRTPPAAVDSGGMPLVAGNVAATAAGLTSSATVTERIFPSPGSRDRDRRRPRSRLSLGRHRRDGDATTGIGTVVSGGSGRDLSTHEHLSGLSLFQQHCEARGGGYKPTVPPMTGARKTPEHAGVTPRPLPRADGLTHKSAALDALADGMCAPTSTPILPCSTQMLSPLSPPPYVGLKNLGNTCYINAVVQALRACAGKIAKLEKATSNRASVEVARHTVDNSRSCSRSERGACRVREPPQVPVARLAGPCLVTSTTSGGATDLAVAASKPENSSGNDRNLLLDTLTALLVQMEESNADLALTNGKGGRGDGDRSSRVSTSFASVVPGVVGARPVTSKPLAGEVDSNASSCGSGVAGKPEAAAESNLLHACGTPVSISPKTVSKAELHAEALTPTALVDLIRREGLDDSHAYTGSSAFGIDGFSYSDLRGRDTLPGFGDGQQCASELLGKLLDVDVDNVVSGNSRHAPVHGPGLAAEFRGALCVRTLCVECERDSVKCEQFTELTLPPLLHNGIESESGIHGEGLPSCEPREPCTLQRLVETVLGSESLGGVNKVWCEACRQWTEAERRSSLHRFPRLLSLHVRQATARGTWLPRPSPSTEFPPSGSGSGGFSHGLVKASQGGDDPVVQRVLTVKAGLKCHCHGWPHSKDELRKGEGVPLPSKENAGCHRRRDMKPRGPGSCDIPHASTPWAVGTTLHDRRDDDGGDDDDDVQYDLVGIILHRGQTFGSGHYTFALNATLDAKFGTTEVTTSTAVPACTKEPAIPAAVSSSAMAAARQKSGENAAKTCAGQMMSGDSAGEGISEVQKCGVPEGCIGAGTSNRASSVAGDEGLRFVLFDDDRVRWLSSDELAVVLRGGGGGGGPGGYLGDAFLVFYCRRERGESI